MIRPLGLLRFAYAFALFPLASGCLFSTLPHASAPATLPLAPSDAAVVPVPLEQAVPPPSEPTAPTAPAEAPVSPPSEPAAPPAESPAAPEPPPEPPPVAPAPAPVALVSTSAAESPPPRVQSYVLLAGVDLSVTVEQKLASIAAGYFARTGKRLVCTSGTRDPDSQAAAIYDLLRLGADVVRLYRHKEAARELVELFVAGRDARKAPAEVTSELATAIRRQMDRGIFISAHLAERAVDVRNRDMTLADRRVFVEEVSKAGGVRLLEERVPPHFHLQLD